MEQMKKIAIKGILALTAVLGIAPLFSSQAETDAEYMARKYASWPEYTNHTKRVTGTKLKLMSGTSDTTPVVENIRARQRPGKFGEDAMIDIYYDLVGTENQCEVSATFTDGGANVASPSIDMGGDIGTGVQPGKDRHFEWHVGKDWTGKKSDKFQVDISATETTIPGTWATVTIEWSNWGGRDLDICAYWIDSRDQKVGYSYSIEGFDTLKWPSKDNTQSGPEKVHCDVGQRMSRILRIHLNYYGSVGRAAKARVIAKGNGKLIKSEEVSTGGTTGRAANFSDPGVEIKFDASNTPVSITSL